MNTQVLLSAAQPIPVHALLALYALIAGGVQFVLPKGTILHRMLGYIWITAMFIVAASSFFINEYRWLGPFGPIHLLSCLVLWSLWRGLIAARRQDVPLHKRMMRFLYFYSLMLAGTFTLMPGRIMYDVVFG